MNIVPIVPPVLLLLMMLVVIIVVVRHHQVLVVETGIFIGASAAVGRVVHDERTSGAEAGVVHVGDERRRGQHAAQGVFSDGVRDAGVLTGGQPSRVGAGHGRGRRVRTREAGRVLLGFESERGDAGGHRRAGFCGGPVVVHAVRVGRGRVRAGRRRNAGPAGRPAQAGAHAARQHGSGGSHAGRHRRRRRVEAVDRVLVVVRRDDRRPQRIHRPREGLGAER